MDWYFWRILTSNKIHATLPELYNQWTLLDLVEAHRVLDALDAVEAHHNQQQQKLNKRGK